MRVTRLLLLLAHEKGDFLRNHGDDDDDATKERWSDMVEERGY